MANNILQQFIPGFRLIDGSALNALISTLNGLFGGSAQQSGIARLSSTSGITAHSGGGRASAVPLVSAINQLSTVAAAADSVVLPVASPGMELFVANDGADAAQVFANGTDTIDGTAGATGVSLAAAGRAIFVCVAAGKWDMLLSA